MIQETLQTVVVSLNVEWMPPKIRLLVLDSLYKAYQFTLTCNKHVMMVGDQSVKESNGTAALVKDCVEARPRSVSLHNEPC